MTGKESAAFPLQSLAPEALVVHCADPRFQDAFRGFATDQLGLKNYAPLAIGGSIHAVGSQTQLPKNYDVLWDQISFFINHASIDRVVIINHADCAWYKANVHLYPEADLDDKEKADLGETYRRLKSEFPDVQVDAYWAALDGDRITFERLEF